MLRSSGQVSSPTCWPCRSRKPVKEQEKNHSNRAGARVQGAGAREFGGGKGQRRDGLFFSFSTYLQSSFYAWLNSVFPGPLFRWRRGQRRWSAFCWNFLRLEDINLLAQGLAVSGTRTLTPLALNHGKFLHATLPPIISFNCLKIWINSSLPNF